MGKDKTYQSIDRKINQSLRYYRVPAVVEKDTALNLLLEKIKAEKSVSHRIINLPAWIRTASAAAAVVILVMISGWMLTNRNISNTGNQVSAFRLPDHSRIILAAESSVRYNTLFLGRKVNLKGKAYFEVEKGSRFRVETRTGKVEVLGTRFTVDDRNEKLQVVCFEGKVRASSRSEEKDLVPGSGIEFSTGKGLKPIATKEEYPGMARFSENYSNSSLNNVLKDLESFFGVSIESQTNQTRYFSGTISTGKLDNALSIVTVSLGLKYKKLNEQKIVIF